MVRLATFNLCNLDAAAPPPRLARVAKVIVHSLGGPDILAVQELAAPGPAAAGGQVPGTAAFQALVAAVAAAGGPRYDYREVPPLEDAEGGLRGANIRLGLLYAPDRVRFVDRGPADPAAAVAVEDSAGRPRLSLSPGRIAPDHPAFAGDPLRHWKASRKALAAEFRVGDATLFVINCHFKSMRGTTRRETASAKKQRHAQAEVVHDFARRILTLQPQARLVLMGDLNDVPGSLTLRVLKGDLLYNLTEDIRKKDRYTRRHGSQAQALDHVLVSQALRPGARVAIPHVNVDSGDEFRASDHDPVLAELFT
ncbi:MAG: endonuclease/exonuclease/phosphatase family protein [Pseudomonadota bacterium]|nr:endonuclease/exonuclease/phosphatase family protein [Pseudomonadota bacterium]